MPQHVAAIRRPVAGIDPIVRAGKGFFVKKHIVYGRRDTLASGPTGAERPVRGIKPVARTAYPVQFPALFLGDSPAFDVPDAERTPQGRVAGPHFLYVLDDEALQLEILGGGQVGTDSVYVAVDLHHRLTARRTDDPVHVEGVFYVNRVYVAPEHLPDLDHPCRVFAGVCEVGTAIGGQGIYFHRG